MGLIKRPCAKCPKYKSCTFRYKDLPAVEYLCSEHPNYIPTPVIKDPTKDPISASPSLSSSVLVSRAGNSLKFVRSPDVQDDVLNIPKSTSIKKIMFDGNMYNLEYLEAFELIRKNNVDIYAIKYLDKEGKLSLENYNDYIDTSISKPLTKEDFDSILKQLL